MESLLSNDISDDFWSKVQPLVPARERNAGKNYRRAAGGGRKPIDPRRVLSAILFVLRNRVAWRAAPESLGSAPTVHRYFEMWKKAGFFDKLSRSGLTAHSEMQGVPWEDLNNLSRDLQLCPDLDATGSVSRKAKKPTRPRDSDSNPPAPSAETPVEVTEREPSLSEPRMQSRLLKLHGSTDVSSFWNAARALLQPAVPHNAIVAYLDYLDHPKTWKAVRILTSPNARMSTNWFEDLWKLDITAPYIKDHQGITFFKFSDIIQNSHELQRTEYFNKLFKPNGWHHTASMPFWNGGGIYSAIALRRTKEQGDYRPGEIEFLKKIHPHLNTVLRRLLPSHKEQTKLRWLADSAQGIPEALMFLDWDLEPMFVNVEALSQCAIWNFGQQKARAYNAREVYKTPAGIARACQELKADWVRLNSGTVSNKEPTLSARVLCPEDSIRSATISLATASRETLFKPSFRIHFDHGTTLRPVQGATPNSLLWRLTPAERDLVELASAGSNNAEIAAKLNKSVNTVKHQLTSIYTKLGVNCPRKRYLGGIV